MRDVDILSRSIPSKPRSGNYPAGTVLSGSNGDVSMNAGGQSVDILRTGDPRSESDANVYSALRVLSDFLLKSKILKTSDTTEEADDNVYSAARVIADFFLKKNIIKRDGLLEDSDEKVASVARLLITFLRKDQDDIANGTITFNKKQNLLGGADFGEFVSSMVAGKGGNIDSRGNGELESLRIRSYLEVLEIIFNRLNAQEGDTTFTDNGSIESVTQEDDGTYTLNLHKRWENDFTSFQNGDVVRGVVNNLSSGTGEYYTAWFRVLNVDRPANKLSVVMYPDDEVPAGKNFPPVPLMNIVRWGNAIDNTDGTYNRRQSSWYISSSEGRVVYLMYVRKPILEDNNYALTLGLPPTLRNFEGKPINYDQPYLYAKGIIVENLIRVDYNGNVVRQENYRGLWSLDTAKNQPYGYTDTTVDVVYHNGCKWQCLKNGTLQEPSYAATDWVMIEGNKAFKIEIDSTKGWNFYPNQLDTELFIIASLYNEDITDYIKDEDVTWTRDSGDVTEDNLWAVKHKDDGKRIHITVDDKGKNWAVTGTTKITVTALLRDGEKAVPAEYAITL